MHAHTSPTLGANELLDSYLNECDDIDYADIARRTQPDQPGGRVVFDSADYATHEEAMDALEALLLRDLLGADGEAAAAT
jgi:hypothetical protein